MTMKLILSRISNFLVLAIAFIFIGFSLPMSVNAQQDDYYEDYGDEPQIQEYEDYADEPQIPDYEDPQEYGDDYIEEPQNPDPEFMDEVEPGEYNQSDDTTELNDGY